MVKDAVLVHTCFSIEAGEPQPTTCACRKRITRVIAKKWIKEGLAEWLVKFDHPKPYHDGNQICMVGRSKCTPRGATIEKAHIERAYVKGDLEEQTRINEYGRMTKDLRNEITVLYSENEWAVAERRNFGRDSSFADDKLNPVETRKEETND